MPTISRASDPRNAGWTAAPAASSTSCIDVCRDLELRPEETVVYICGNPDMIINVEELLMDRGFPEFHVKKELYWPKGKVVPGAEAAPTPAGSSPAESLPLRVTTERDIRPVEYGPRRCF